ncbi:ComF family protein [Patescibacteria group bacterium]|nr:ComF family protein [Patescibacteria group bacterium]
MWKRIKNFLLDLFLPIHCLDCGKEKTFICPPCLAKINFAGQKTLFPINPLDKILIALDYHQPMVKKAIHCIKYPPHAQIGLQDLSKLLIKFIKKLPGVTYTVAKDNFVLVPIPLTKHKLASRGFNQAELIAQELSQEFKWPLAKILKKTKDNQSQTKLTPKQRKINVKNVFKIKTGWKNKCPKNIILVDDIITTGATLKEAARILRQSGVKKIWAMVLAKG